MKARWTVFSVAAAICLQWPAPSIANMIWIACDLPAGASSYKFFMIDHANDDVGASVVIIWNGNSYFQELIYAFDPILGTFSQYTKQKQELSPSISATITPLSVTWSNAGETHTIDRQTGELVFGFRNGAKTGHCYKIDPQPIAARRF